MSVQSGVFTPADRAEASYRYLPVDVPPGCAGVTIELEYERGVLDLGCFGPAGFRGWSGGARRQFSITADWATPGYLPGELEAGEWQVVLGLHRVPVDGLPWRVSVVPGRVSPPADPLPPPLPERPPARPLPAPAGMRWLAGDLHTHTVHSDGSLTVDELAALAVGQGLDFLAVTDHNTVSHHSCLPAAGLRAGVVLVPGQEVTTHRGHANAFGDIGWVDFRAPADQWVEGVELLSINHPLAADCSWRYPLERRPALAEIWHWTWLDRRWGGPMAWWQAAGPALVPVGGSDFHRPEQDRLPGEPTTWVLVSQHDVDGVLDGLRAGRTALSARRAGPVLLRLGDELVAVDAEGLLLAGATGRRRLVCSAVEAFPASPGPHWLEDGTTAVHALCG
ncbi:MAG: CehA/McbA family metallohydrolase [Geodermatophilaceae bacterium]|nr:CehA/McbA family metallohydrolase [Geodermatophilaceae bacterium]MDQ3466284.1 CehA/McbA family metallohydrolase [Actinomycetota bacterium]